jgi:hypothetical protein
VRISEERLAGALAARLDPVVPRPFRVRADGANVTVDHPAGWGFTTFVGTLRGDSPPPYDFSWAETAYAPADSPPASEPTELERVAAAVWAVLSAVQDVVSEATTEPWPLVPPRQMALPETRADGEALHLWYGPVEAAPGIAFTPIPLRDIAAVE